MQHGDISLPVPPPHFWAMEELLDFWGEGMLGGAKRLYHLQQHNLAPGGAVHPTGSGHGEVRGPSVLLFCPPPHPRLCFAGSACKVVPKTRCNPRAEELGNLWCAVFWWRAVCSRPAAPGEGFAKNIYICMHIHFICNKAKRGEEEAGAVSSWPAAPGCQSALVSSQPSGGAVGAGFPPGGHIVHRLPSQLGLQKRGMQPGVPPSPIVDV